MSGTTLSYTVTGLTEATTYNFKIEALNLAGNWSATYLSVNAYSGGGTWTGGGGQGTAPFMLLNTCQTTATPGSATSDTGDAVAGSSSVPVNATFKLNFSKNVISNWITNQDCFTVQDGSGASVPVNAFIINNDAEKNNVFIAPVSPLNPGSAYKIIISANLKANSGASLGSNVAVCFTTAGGAGSGGTSGGGGSSGGDIQAPTWPNKTFKTATKAGQTVTLEWYSATDNVGVTKYRIYHGTEQIGEVDGNITRFTYTQPTGTGQGSQPYSVQAGDAAGNWSTDGPSVTLGGSNLPLIVEYGVYRYDPGSNTTPPTPVGSVLTSGKLTEVPTTFSSNTAIGIKFATNVAVDTRFSSNQAVFQLLDASGNSVSIRVDRSGDGTPSDVNRNYLFVIPQVALKSGSSYKIIIGPDLTSNNGMSAGVQQEIDFTTAGSPETPGSGGAITTSGPTFTTGSASVDPAVGATVGLGDNARIVIPANALKGTSSVTVTVKEVTSPPAVPSGFKIAGKVYEFTVGDQSNYTFNTRVGITLSFDPSALSSDETAAVFYYDQSKQQWVNLGGTVSGNTITVEVDHLTKFAVFAVKKTAAPVVQPGTLTDIVGHWAEADIKKLVGLGAVSGYPDGTFKPDSTITRAEFATVLVKAFKLDLRTARLFKDTAGHWARDYISTAAVFGIVNGYDADTFGPDDLISREQMAAMIVKAAKLELINEETKFADRADISEWARSAVATAVKNGIIKGYTDNTFRPQGNATRAEAVTVIVNTLRLQIH